MEQITTDSHCPMLCGHPLFLSVVLDWNSHCMGLRPHAPQGCAATLPLQLPSLATAQDLRKLAHFLHISSYPPLVPHSQYSDQLFINLFFFFLSRMLCSLASSLVCSRRKELPASLQPSGNLHHSQNILPLPLMFSR